MVPGLDLGNIDRSDPAIDKLLDVIGGQFEHVLRERDELKERNVQMAKENAQMKDQIAELTKLVEQLQRRNGRRARSYNAREFKDYPRPGETSRKPPAYAREPETFGTVIEKTDHKFCPVCVDPLAETASYYDRNCGEDVRGGGRCNVRLRRFGRYCRGCGRMQYADAPNFLPHMRLGVNALAMISAMRHLTISYGKIEKLFSTMYRRSLPTSRLEDADALVSAQLEPVYDDLVAGLEDAEILGGDETGWYKNGRLGWAWVFQTPDTVVFHLSGSRSKAVSGVPA